MKRFFDVDRTFSILAHDVEAILAELRARHPDVEITTEPITRRNLTHRVRFDGMLQGWIENSNGDLK